MLPCGADARGAVGCPGDALEEERVIAPGAWDHGLALLCGLIVPALGVWQQRKLAAAGPNMEPFDTREKIALFWSNSVVLWILAGAAVFVWWQADRSLPALGLTAAPEEWAIGSALAAAVLAGYAADVAWHLGTSRRRAETRRRWRKDTPFMPETWREAAHSLVLVTSAAVCEEIVFRGFLITYLIAFTGTSFAGLAVAVAVPALVFAACHAYQGGHAMVKIAAGAVLFGALLLVTGSLWIPIALHFLVDLAGAALGPLLMGSRASDGAGAERTSSS